MGDHLQRGQDTDNGPKSPVSRFVQPLCGDARNLHLLGRQRAIDILDHVSTEVRRQATPLLESSIRLLAAKIDEPVDVVPLAVQSISAEASLQAHDRLVGAV